MRPEWPIESCHPGVPGLQIVFIEPDVESVAPEYFGELVGRFGIDSGVTQKDVSVPRNGPVPCFIILPLAIVSQLGPAARDRTFRRGELRKQRKTHGKCRSVRGR
jgi:hypothetical protein